MTMRGSLSTESEVGPWSRVTAAIAPGALAGSFAVGVLAGLFMATVRLNLGMPGHKALFWMIPLLVARLSLRCPVGGTVAALGAACTSVAMGGHLAGGIAFVPLVGLAGGVLDALVAFAERHRLGVFWLIPLLAVGGAGANLLCAVKRMLTPQYQFHMLLGLTGRSAQLLSYAIFGWVSGLAGAILGTSAERLVRRKRPGRSGPQDGV